MFKPSPARRGPGNCSGMEETTGAPSSFAVWRLRASSRDGGDGGEPTPVNSHYAAFATYKAVPRELSSTVGFSTHALTEDRS